MNKYHVQNIVAQRELCVSCGACSVVCPHDAITYQFAKGLYMPHVEEDKCIGCRKCLQGCPSFQVDLQGMTRKEAFEGNVLTTCIAYTNDTNLRMQCASGGVITQMIIGLLGKHLYDKACVVDFPNNDRERVCACVTDKVEDVIKAAKSKYLPVSIEKVLLYISEHKEEHVIIIATPCQLEAIRRFVAANHLNEDNYLYLGLFCEATMNHNFQTFIQWKYGFYNKLVFREKEAGGWPGNMALYKDSGKEILSREVRMQLKPYFKLNRCNYCFDKLNRNADISFGDCYIHGTESFEGKSNVIVRTEKGCAAWKAVLDRFSIEPCTMQNIVVSQDIYAKEAAARKSWEVSLLYKNLSFLPSAETAARPVEQIIGNQADSTTGCIRLDERLSQRLPRNKYHRLIKRIGKIFEPRQQKYLLIDHAGFINKGAELMLRETVKKAKQYFPEYALVLPIDVYRENVGYCVQNGLLPMREEAKGVRKKVKHILSNQLLSQRKYVLPSEIALILDIGGFMLSDQWCSDGYYANWQTYYSQFTHPKLKICFLPQAFGPFQKQEARNSMQYVYDIADVIYAREETSYRHLMEVCPDSRKIKMASDFTCLLKPHLAVAKLIPDKQYVVIIPNMRMVDKRSDDNGEYKQFLSAIISQLLDAGEQVALLNHEGIPDEYLAQEINAVFGGTLPVLTDLSALEVKALIGKAKLLISSRFHGVVSGLSQGIPTFCTSWSHKYQELLKDYKVPQNLLDMSDLDSSMAKIREALLSPQHYAPTLTCIQEKEQEALLLWHNLVQICN